MLIGLVLMLMLSSIALAEEVTQQLGPYNVSLDMKSNMKYQIQTSAPIERPTFTAYPMRLFTDNSTFSEIVIYENKNPTDSTPAIEKSITGLTLMLSGFNVTKSEDKVIDGKEGFVLTGEPLPGNQAAPRQFVQASYWIDSKECECGPVSVGKTKVVMGSSYPNDVTNGILNSLKIMKSQ
jgi:hypothetical protein